MVMRDTADVLEAVSTHPSVRPGPMAAVGYCMGGGFALSAAGTFPDRVVAAASFHGGSLATDKPDSPHLLAARMRARLYIGVAGIDPTFDDEQRQRLEAALDAAGASYELEIYDGAKHGFAVNGHLAYDRDAAERHWTALLALLRATLGSGTARASVDSSASAETLGGGVPRRAHATSVIADAAACAHMPYVRFRSPWPMACALRFHPHRRISHAWSVSGDDAARCRAGLGSGT